MKHRYFFSYQAGRVEGGVGVGNFTADLDHPIRSSADLDPIVEAIRITNPGNTAVIIMSWQRFEDGA
jgi:hypothetical protein